MTIKDLFEVEGLTCDAGFPEFAEHVSTTDRSSRARLKAAGAIIIGKTNSPWPACQCKPITTCTARPIIRIISIIRRAVLRRLGSRPVAGLTLLEYGSDIGGSIRTPSHFWPVRPCSAITMRCAVTPPHGMALEPSELSVAGPLASSPPVIGVGTGADRRRR